MDQVQWLIFDKDARLNLDKDYVYYIRTKDGDEYSGMYPNGEGFHCQNPGEPRRVAKEDVRYYAVQMPFDDHADQFVFGRG